jgi:hypothetical protein
MNPLNPVRHPGENRGPVLIFKLSEKELDTDFHRYDDIE